MLAESMSSTQAVILQPADLYLEGHVCGCLTDVLNYMRTESFLGSLYFSVHKNWSLGLLSVSHMHFG